MAFVDTICDATDTSVATRKLSDGSSVVQAQLDCTRTWEWWIWLTKCAGHTHAHVNVVHANVLVLF